MPCASGRKARIVSPFILIQKVCTVILRKHIGTGGVAALVLGLLLTPPAARAEDKTRDQQIADLEKQIQDLTKKLNDLKAQPATSPAPPAPPKPALPDDWVGALKWRCIGPAAMGGRIVAFSVFEADPSTYWVATASGGLLKTTNNGVTFEHQFDHESTVSVGDVCVAPSDRNIVWVGSGENNPRNSVSYGDGVYKSTDGGKTWQNMGLKKSFQIGRVVVHPKDPNIVYVGALGRLYGPNEERGLFKTTDGGKTWNKVLYIDDRTGIIDVKMNPADPETLLVAAWERKRDEFDSHRGDPPVQDGYDAYDPDVKWGKGAGIYKTTDGGKTFHKITKGLPTVPLGRIGFDYYRKDPTRSGPSSIRRRSAWAPRRARSFSASRARTRRTAPGRSSPRSATTRRRRRPDSRPATWSRPSIKKRSKRTRSWSIRSRRTRPATSWR